MSLENVSIDTATGRLKVGGGGGGSSNILWQWDGTLGQFTLGATPELDTGGGALSLATGRFNQPVLRATCGTGVGFSQWVIKTSEFPTLPSRYVLDIEYDQFSDGAASFNVTDRVGFSHFCQYISPGNVLAYSLCQYGNINNYFQLWTRTTTFANAAGTPIGRGPGSGVDRGVRHIAEAMQDLSGTYDINLRTTFEGQANISYYTNNKSNTLNLDAGAYDGKTPNTFGLAAAWSTVNHFADISIFRILKHPADQT